MPKRLQSVFKSHYVRMLSFVRRQIHNAEEAEDILQEVFGKASERMEILATISDLPGWLWTSLRNRIVDYYRRQATGRKRTGSELSLDSEENNISLHDLVADARQNIEKEWIRSMLADMLYESLKELPEKQKSVFLLQAVEGRTFAEIAEMTGESINTLTARKRYAVNFLRKRLEECKLMMEEENV